MRSLSENSLNSIPSLYSQESKMDPVVVAKLFNQKNNNVLFIIESDGRDSVYGYLMGKEGSEFGFFSLKNLSASGFEVDNKWVDKNLYSAKNVELALDESAQESAILWAGQEDVGRVWGGYTTRTNLIEGNRLGYRDGGYVFFIPNKIDMYDDRYDCRVGGVVVSESDTHRILEEAGYMPEEIEDVMWRAKRNQKSRGIALSESVELEIKTYHSVMGKERVKSIYMKDLM